MEGMSSIEKAVSSSPLEDYQAIGQAAKKQVLNRFFVASVCLIVVCICWRPCVKCCLGRGGLHGSCRARARGAGTGAGKGCSGTVEVSDKTNEPHLALPSTSGKSYTVSSPPFVLFLSFFPSRCCIPASPPNDGRHPVRVVLRCIADFSPGCSRRFLDIAERGGFRRLWHHPSRRFLPAAVAAHNLAPSR